MQGESIASGSEKKGCSKKMSSVEPVPDGAVRRKARIEGCEKMF
jgi:hypothetical protein